MTERMEQKNTPGLGSKNITGRENQKNQARRGSDNPRDKMQQRLRGPIQLRVNGEQCYERQNWHSNKSDAWPLVASTQHNAGPPFILLSFFGVRPSAQQSSDPEFPQE
jgi:hypothetical protein